MSSSSKSPLFFLYHIKESIEAIASYLQDGGKDAFLHRRMVQMAVLHELVIIGEAANNLSDDLKATYSHIPWRDIVDFRNVLAHHYWGVDMEVVWKIIEDGDKLPKLRSQVRALIDELENQ
ncbi:MAG: DUF86 domain-containing protein [Hormoscilla sp. SP12CHS1]|nr:DUF86 domain-containing protein [Hormoscilla sp. SP12CHS1]